MTKSFVATLVLQLVGEGRLGLDDKLERWLPGLVPSGERITVRQLLNHTSELYSSRSGAGVLTYSSRGRPSDSWSSSSRLERSMPGPTRP